MDLISVGFAAPTDPTAPVLFYVPAQVGHLAGIYHIEQAVCADDPDPVSGLPLWTVLLHAPDDDGLPCRFASPLFDEEANPATWQRQGRPLRVVTCTEDAIAALAAGGPLPYNRMEQLVPPRQAAPSTPVRGHSTTVAQVEPLYDGRGRLVRLTVHCRHAHCELALTPPLDPTDLLGFYHEFIARYRPQHWCAALQRWAEQQRLL